MDHNLDLEQAIECSHRETGIHVQVLINPSHRVRWLTGHWFHLDLLSFANMMKKHPPPFMTITGVKI